MTDRAERISSQIADLMIRRFELRAQLYAIAGDAANADRERALDSVERQLTRLHVEAASLMEDE